MNAQQADCLGCRLAHRIVESHIVFENEWVACLLDIDPFRKVMYSFFRSSIS